MHDSRERGLIPPESRVTCHRPAPRRRARPRVSGVSPRRFRQSMAGPRGVTVHATAVFRSCGLAVQMRRIVRPVAPSTGSCHSNGASRAAGSMARERARHRRRGHRTNPALRAQHRSKTQVFVRIRVKVWAGAVTRRRPLPTRPPATPPTRHHAVDWIVTIGRNTRPFRKTPTLHALCAQVDMCAGGCAGSDHAYCQA